MKLRPWLQFFRLPNLPTAPGDALAGAALLLGAFPETFGARLSATMGGLLPALASGAAAWFFYLFGLADNDIAGAAEDARNTPERPIPSGRISMRAAKLARVLCLLMALGIGAVADLPWTWWVVAAWLVAVICIYNRVKGALLMGCCRGLSLLAGGAALFRGDMVKGTHAFELGGDGATMLVGVGALLLAALGWILYIGAVTKLSEGEERESEGLGNRRYVLGLAAFVPLTALVPIVGYRLMLPEVIIAPTLILLPLLSGLWTFSTWCAAVGPLWMAHGPAERRAAVGRTIGALLQLQIGFMLLAPNPVFMIVALFLWFAARTIRRLAPSISGS